MAAGQAESVQGDLEVAVTVGRRIIANTMDVGVVALKERSGGDFGSYIIWLDLIFQLNRVNC